jgi:hypothetical protein
MLAPGVEITIGATTLVAEMRDFTDGDHRDRRIAITENDRWRSR